MKVFFTDMILKFWTWQLKVAFFEVNFQDPPVYLGGGMKVIFENNSIQHESSITINSVVARDVNFCDEEGMGRKRTFENWRRMMPNVY